MKPKPQQKEAPAAFEIGRGASVAEALEFEPVAAAAPVEVAPIAETAEEPPTSEITEPVEAFESTEVTEVIEFAENAEPVAATETEAERNDRSRDRPRV